MSFDVYVFSPCNEPPGELPGELAHSLTRVEEDFLHLDFPTRAQAAELVTLLRAHGGDGRVIDARYREPHITQEQARGLAEQELEELKKLCEPAQYDSLEFHSDEPMFWVFRAVSPELVARGKVPGALFPSIDKYDGHPWRTADFDSDANATSSSASEES